MNAIITPESIYFISILKNIDQITFVILALSLSITAGLLICLISEYESTENEKKWIPCPDGYKEDVWITDPKIARYKKLLKWSVAIFAISALIKVFIPTEKEMYAIAIAPYITADNLEMIKNGIIDFVKAMR